MTPDLLARAQQIAAEAPPLPLQARETLRLLRPKRAPRPAQRKTA